MLKSVTGPDDCCKMQSDLNKIYEWAAENNMSFNSEKFELLRYKVDDLMLEPYLTPNGCSIDEVSQVKDLGILLDNTAMFEGQIEQAANRATNMSRWVMRVFKTREELPMLTLFRAMVLPHLEYCVQLWSPHLLKDIRRLEAVQRSFTFRISELNQLTYWERLAKLKLYSIERRRERYVILYIFKIISNLVPNFSDERFSIKTYSSVRGNRLCRVPRVSRSSSARIRRMVENSFAVRGPQLFNCLPVELRNYQGSLMAFKLKLDKYLLRIRDQPCTPGYHQSATSNSIVDQLAQMRADGVFL